MEGTPGAQGAVGEPGTDGSRGLPGDTGRVGWSSTFYIVL